MRAIGDVEHPSIRDADELLVYFYRDKRFRKVHRYKFPMEKCLICLKKYQKTYNLLSKCKFKTDQWSLFKKHIKKAEHLFGELIAFPVNTKKLPDISEYEKFRLYGYTLEYQNKARFYIFDLNQKRFVHIDRQCVRKKYIDNNYCNYCKCGRTILSSSLLISHLSTLESKYHCFLLIDNLGQNDQKNQQRINLLVKDYEDGKFLNDKAKKKINNNSSNNSNNVKDNNINDNNSNDKNINDKNINNNKEIDNDNQKDTISSRSLDELMNDLNDDSDVEIDESKLKELEMSSNSDDKSVTDQINSEIQSTESIEVDESKLKALGLNLNGKSITDDIQSNYENVCISSTNQTTTNDTNEPLVDQFKNSLNSLNSLIEKLDDKVNSSLRNSLIREQTTLSLDQKIEKYREKKITLNLSFSKKLLFNKLDLNELLSRYKISENLEIDSAEINLNLVMKDPNSLTKDNCLSQNGDLSNNVLDSSHLMNNDNNNHDSIVTNDQHILIAANSTTDQNEFNSYVRSSDDRQLVSETSSSSSSEHNTDDKTDQKVKQMEIDKIKNVKQEQYEVISEDDEMSEAEEMSEDNEMQPKLIPIHKLKQAKRFNLNSCFGRGFNTMSTDRSNYVPYLRK